MLINVFGRSKIRYSISKIGLAAMAVEIEVGKAFLEFSIAERRAAKLVVSVFT